MAPWVGEQFITQVNRTKHVEMELAIPAFEQSDRVRCHCDRLLFLSALGIYFYYILYLFIFLLEYIEANRNIQATKDLDLNSFI